VEFRQIASAYNSRTKILVCGSLATKAGFRILGSVFELSIDAPTGDLGKTVLEALDASVGEPRDAPKPAEYAVLNEPLLTLSGARTYIALATASKFVSISVDGGSAVIFTPNRNCIKAEKTFRPIPERRLKCESAEVQLLGKCLADAFDQCE
jgi:hypothetical protein